jgi:hypothetical protein
MASNLAEVTPVDRDEHGRPAHREGSDYALASGAIQTRLVFPRGPRMQLRWVIEAPERRYVLRDTFRIELTYLEDGTVFAKHRRLPVHGYGETQAEAISAFCEAFDHQWRHLVEAAPETLAAHAMTLRESLQAAVSDVV